MLCNRSMKLFQSNVHIVHPDYLSSQSGDVVRASDDLELSLKTSRIEQLYIIYNLEDPTLWLPFSRKRSSIYYPYMAVFWRRMTRRE